MPSPPSFRRKTIAILQNARNLIKLPEFWTQGCLARRANGLPVFYRDEAACSWCIAGAVLREQMVFPESGQEALNAIAAAINVRRSAIVPMTISQFNDEPLQKHSEVLAVFDDAIKLLKAQERKK